MGSPVITSEVAFTAASSTGTTSGNSSRGSRVWLPRTWTVMAAYSVPGADRPAVPRRMRPASANARPAGASYRTTMKGTRAKPRSASCAQLASALP